MRESQPETDRLFSDVIASGETMPDFTDMDEEERLRAFTEYVRSTKSLLTSAQQMLEGFQSQAKNASERAGKAEGAMIELTVKVESLMTDVRGLTEEVRELVKSQRLRDEAFSAMLAIPSQLVKLAEAVTGLQKAFIAERSNSTPTV